MTNARGPTVCPDPPRGVVFSSGSHLRTSAVGMRGGGSILRLLPGEKSLFPILNHAKSTWFYGFEVGGNRGARDRVRCPRDWNSPGRNYHFSSIHRRCRFGIVLDLRLYARRGRE